MKSVFLLCLCALSLTPTALHADTFQTFNYEGTYAIFELAGTVSGNITIDTTTGVATAASPFTVTGITITTDPEVFAVDTPPEVLADPNLESLEIVIESTAPTSFADVDLLLPVTTLVGYAGSSLCTDATRCSGFAASDFSPVHIRTIDFATGSITPAGVTPEPSSLVLLGTGLIGVLGATRRRLRW